MPINVGPFFDIVIMREALETQYPGGLDKFVVEMGLQGSISDDFIVYGTMGQDDTIRRALELLQIAYMNCDEESPHCVYVHTAHYCRPKKHRDWLCIKEIAKNHIELSVDPAYKCPELNRKQITEAQNRELKLFWGHNHHPSEEVK